MLIYEGSSTFRHIIICSLLSRRSITIEHIHEDEDPVGINRSHEANFLKFIQRVTMGTKMEVHNDNTTLVLHPGIISGGSFEHDVPTTRCVSYVIEAALLLLPFAKSNSKIRFIGCTQGLEDLSIDTLRVITCRILQMFGIDIGIRVIKRGCAPEGKGVVEVSVNIIKQLKSIKLLERGKIKRVRGIAFACKVSPDLPQRVATSAKGTLLNILPDVYVVADLDKNAHSGGYGIVLVGETTSKMTVLAAETIAEPQETAEAVGERAARLFLDQAAEGGCLDSQHQMMALLMMAMGPMEASTIRFGPLTPSGVTALTLMEQFFGVTCAIKSEDAVHEGLPATTLVTCVGSNLVNIVKKSA